MVEDILHRIRTNFKLEFNAEIHNETLISSEDLCRMMSSKMLHELGMPTPNRLMSDIFNQEFE